ncbi:unnamed protein product [Caenorhabditis brenneri]
MSLSRPARFPLLKLPFLCIECVVKSWNVFDIIYFALTSTRARQIVKHLKIPLNRIEICLSGRAWIELDDTFRKWHFRNEREKTSTFDKHKNLRKYPLVLQENAEPLYTSEMDCSLVSYTGRNEATAVKLAMEFLNEVFKCSVKAVHIHGSYFPESGDIGVRFTVHLYILNSSESPSLDYAQGQKLNLLLKNLEVTDTCTFSMRNTENGFYCDPKLLKCQNVVFWSDSAAWVTREILMQFEVPRLRFFQWAFSVKDLSLFIANWFHSDNKTFEHLYIQFQNGQVSLEEFQTEELNPVPFSGETRIPLSRSDFIIFKGVDYFKGLEIVRHDGLAATIHANGITFLFHVWHNQ